MAHEGVKEDAHDGHGGAHHGEQVHGVVKEEHRGGDDEDALERVAHRERHGVHVAQREVHDLVVNVVPEAGLDNVPRERTCAPVLLDRRGPGPRRFAPLHAQRERRQHQQRADGHHTVEVLGADLLALVLGRQHGRLGENGPEGEEHVGRHGRCEAQPREAELLGARQRHAPHHGHEGEVHGCGEDLAAEQRGEERGEDGHTGLDHVGEGHRRSLEDHDRCDLPQAVGEGHADGQRAGLGAQGGHRAQAEQPQQRDVEGADEELDG
mmetsp:Transcript_763/g.2576  ORF Transcript_763/g.2576 Transcript_763/m.2576 type:complete len:266 (-) Transcript_763:217-1014(-)